MTEKDFKGARVVTEILQMGLLIWWSFITHYSREVVLMVWIVNCELTIWLLLCIFRAGRGDSQEGSK
jgi:hypothetical protein